MMMRKKWMRKRLRSKKPMRRRKEWRRKRRRGGCGRGTQHFIFQGL